MKRSEPANPARLLGSAVLPLSVALLLSACNSGDPVPARAEPEPVGKAQYERLLAEYSGLPLGVEELVETARRERRWIEARLSEAAERLSPGTSWQEVFSKQREEHPGTVEDLLEAYRGEVRRAEEFVRDLALMPIPDEALEVIEARHPVFKQSFPLALYIDGKLAVVASRGADPDPHYLALHCTVCIPPLAVHEGIPGHHAGMQYLPPEDRRGVSGTGWFFLEGWAQYAEILMLENGFYGEPEELLGAWQLVLVRALRAELDPLLHTREISEEEAVERYQREALFTREAAKTEVRRHLESPTMKAAYLVGLLQVLELRRLVGETVPADFHTRLVQERGTYPEIGRTSLDVELRGLCSLSECYSSSLN